MEMRLAPKKPAVRKTAKMTIATGAFIIGNFTASSYHFFLKQASQFPVVFGEDVSMFAPKLKSDILVVPWA
jgi:hypothetical protein